MGDAVLIAGAGPVGLTMAMALKRLGVDVRIVDPAPQRTDKSKALVLWSRTLEMLDLQGCSAPFLDAGLKGRGARVKAQGRDLVHVDFSVARSRFNFPLFLPQSETERLLEAELDGLGVKVERRVALASFSSDDGGVAATLTKPDGGSEEARFAYLIGCDGAHSAVRHGAHADFEGSTEPSDWILADLHLDGDIAPDDVVICWEPAGILVLFPIAAGRFRVIADHKNPSGEAGPEPTLEEVQALLDARGPRGLKAHDPFWLSRFHINERKVKDYRFGRVFLAGDAAHIHSPAGGQGMNTGMQDAFNLGWKLALVIQGHASARLLDSYSVERSAIGEAVLRNASAMTHVAIMRNPILQEIRNQAAGVLGHIPALRHRFVNQLAELDLAYPDSPLTARAPGFGRHPANGHRAPDVGLSASVAGATRLYELLRGGRFAVLSLGADAIDLPLDLARIAHAARAEPDDDYPIAGHVLVRPDGYVAITTTVDHPARVIAHLRMMLGT